MYVNSEPTTEPSVDIEWLYFVQLFDRLTRWKHNRRYFVLFKNNTSTNVFKSHRRPSYKKCRKYLHLNRDNYRNECKVLLALRKHDCIVSWLFWICFCHLRWIPKTFLSYDLLNSEPLPVDWSLWFLYFPLCLWTLTQRNYHSIQCIKSVITHSNCQQQNNVWSLTEVTPGWVSSQTSW